MAIPPARPGVLPYYFRRLLGRADLRQLHIRYLTPTVGLMIRSPDYLNYIENLESMHPDEFIFIKSKKSYPVAKISGVRIDLMHYAIEAEALKKYSDRHARIDRTKIFYKIDFGKKRYTRSDIDRWNRLQLKFRRLLPALTRDSRERHP